MSNTKVRFFRLAKVVSKTSTYPRKHFGAVIVSRRRLISSGVNRFRTHPKQKKYSPFRYECRHDAETDEGRVHAEMDAIIKAGRANLEGSSIYVYREDMHGKIADSKPCGACMQAIRDKGIKNVYYTSREGFNHLELQ
jgi:deoxycytidylate deaminase